MKTNYHTHTYRCKHAWGDDEDYVLAAIEAGFDVLGFADHTPWKYNSNYEPYMRMSIPELDNYISSLKYLKEKYKDQIEIRIGLECEYFPDYMPWLREMLKEKEIDYIILGNHYKRSDETGIYYGGRTRDKKLLKSYVDTCIEAIDTGLYSYIAHPDLIDYYDTKSVIYKKEMTRLCRYASQKGMLLEYNLTGIIGKRNYPCDDFWKIAAQEGCKAIIGYDAHLSKVLKNDRLYQQANIYLQNSDIKIVRSLK